ncbi:MAG: twin-arginine translocase TatA/TatE family subunit [Alphaproteobacteria bacterium]
MGTFSIWHWVIVLAIVLLLFGRGKIPSLMGDMAKGIKAFKSGMKEDPEEKKSIDDATTAAADSAVNETAVKKDEATQG